MSLVVSNGGGQGSGSAPELLVNWTNVSVSGSTSTTIYTASQSCKLYLLFSNSSQNLTLNLAFNRPSTNSDRDCQLVSMNDVPIYQVNKVGVLSHNPTTVAIGISSFELNIGDYVSGYCSSSVNVSYCIYSR